MPHKVIVWGTGFTGKMVVRELLDHPAFELVGVIVNARQRRGGTSASSWASAPSA
jgi:4-hydroxy-tetrahydrodipicolinate reductase